jgi:hypothetical protein
MSSLFGNRFKTPNVQGHQAIRMIMSTMGHLHSSLHSHRQLYPQESVGANPLTSKHLRILHSAVGSDILAIRTWLYLATDLQIGARCGSM